MSVKVLMQFVQRFKCMDMSGLTSLKAKQLTVKEGHNMGLTATDIEVALDNIFGAHQLHSLIVEKSLNDLEHAEMD